MSEGRAGYVSGLMGKKRSLKLVEQPARQGLGQQTVMDRALAARYGAAYVHLAAFAIDVDRLFQATPEHAPLPFGWEVRLTEAYVLSELDAAADPSHQSLLEDVCLGVLESRSNPPPLGAQLSFAVYCAVQRGLLPQSLSSVFDSWRKPPTELADEVAALAADPDCVARLARHALSVDLDPPLVAPVRETLQRYATG